MQDDEKQPVDGEVIPPKPAGSDNGDPPPPSNVLLAQVSNYTNRPDLFLETIEKHDPGFIKRMNEDAESFNKKARGEMFSFGKNQAYAGMIVSIIAAVFILGIIVLAVFFKNIGFGQILALGIVYAITQAGTSGFSNIAGQIAKIAGRGKNNIENPPSEE